MADDTADVVLLNSYAGRRYLEINPLQARRLFPSAAGNFLCIHF